MTPGSAAAAVLGRPVERLDLAVVGLGVGVRVIGFALAVLLAGSLGDVVFRWDASWYRDIATGGYGPVPADPGATQTRWAFFPVWPAVLAVLVRLPLPPELTVVGFGLALTVVDLLLAVRLLEPKVGARDARLAALFIGAAPPAWTYLAAYSEGLFVTMELLLLLAVDRRRLGLAALLGGAVGLTRAQGAIWAGWVALIIVRALGRRAGRWPTAVGLAAFPLLVAAAWPGVLTMLIGRPDAYALITSAPGWDNRIGLLVWQRAADALLAPVIGYRDWRGPALLLVIVMVAVAVVNLARRPDPLPGRWPTILLALLPFANSGSLTSIPRYVGQLPLVHLGLTPLARSPVRLVLAVGGVALFSIGMSVSAFVPGFLSSP